MVRPLIPVLTFNSSEKIEKGRKSKDSRYNGEIVTKKTHKVVKTLHTILKIEQLGGERMWKKGGGGGVSSSKHNPKLSRQNKAKIISSE
jgi:hypothetical protein